MKTQIVSRLIPALLLASTAMAAGEPKKEVVIRRHVAAEGPQFHQELEKEKVAYLGVETMPVDPTVAAQLGLPRGTGIVVRRVADGSPAASLLKQHDVLTKIDDQILVNMQQLTVLVRSHQAGDEVKLTYLRGGKETVSKVKLAEHEVPKLAGEPFLFNFGEGGPGGNFFFQHGGGDLPGLAGPEAGDVMRLIGGDRPNWFARPRVHVFKHSGEKGSTVLDLPSGNFVFSDDDGSVEMASNDGKRELTVKNKQGEVTFKGPLNTPEDHAKLPPEVVARLDAIGGAHLDDDDDDLEIETKVLAPTTKTRQALPSERAPEGGLRTL